MDVDDLVARRAALTDPLSSTLSSRWPGVPFDLDAEAATARPGAAVRISWQDGPCADAVEMALSPTWSSLAEPGHGQYPVTLSRSFSPVATAGAVLDFYDAGQLATAVHAGTTAFEHVLVGHLAPQDLSDANRPMPARATLLAEIVRGHCGPDPFTWALWLIADGQRVIDDVLPAALDTPRATLRPVTGDTTARAATTPS